MMGSRFVECPFCGQNVAMHLATIHAEAHLSDTAGSQEHNTASNKRAHHTTPLKTGKETGCGVVQGSSRDVSKKHKSENSQPEWCSKRAINVSSPGRQTVSDHQVNNSMAIRDAAEDPGNEPEAVAPQRQKTEGDWTFLKNPTAKDVRGPRRTRKAFDLPARPYDYLVVLDFEWTCDNRTRLEPLEIIEFPAVLVKTSFPPAIVSEFQVYCRPEVNPILTKFCKELTAITQEQVEAGVSLPAAIELNQQWLNANLPGGIGGGATFAMVTWSDADIMGALHSELRRRGLSRPAHFDSWINLKALYKGHYKREPKGGLQRCVEACGLSFDGRAHSGLVDSINTAKICIQMISQGYCFTRTTRGFGPDGEAWGSAEARRQRARREEDSGQERGEAASGTRQGGSDQRHDRGAGSEKRSNR